MRFRLWTLSMLLLAVPVAAGQDGRALDSSEATAFMGTWVLSMTNPQGAHETVRIWDKNGVVAASLQTEMFPPQDATGIFKNGERLIVTATRFENGRPIWAVIVLTLEGETMTMAQMLEFSQTIKRGTGKRR